MRPAALPFIALLLALPLANSAEAADEARGNFFDDPFLQATDGRPDCAVPEGPLVTRSQMLAESHGRVERGTSCYQAGRCRLANAYFYDKEIIPRVKKALVADGRFTDTAIWAEGQRRWVWLKGCVSSTAQKAQAEKLVRAIDDVENVVNELKVVPLAPAAKKASGGAANSR